MEGKGEKNELCLVDGLGLFTSPRVCAQLGHKVGWFPSNYTQEELDDAHTYCMAENVLDIMVALYSFKVRSQARFFLRGP